MIMEKALYVSVGRASPAEIDSLNILWATMLAMKRAVDSLGCVPELVLVDGNRLPKWDYPSVAVVKGDALVPEISAASIVAKVTRDHEMLELDRLHPEYGFGKHKGYPTKDHLEAIRKYGLIEGYRKSFGPVKKILLEN